MIPDTTWEPTPSDIAWQQGWINLLRKRATWAVPGSLSIFNIDKDRMIFSLSRGDPKDETNRRIAKVFRKLGFTEGAVSKDIEPADRFPPSVN